MKLLSYFAILLVAYVQTSSSRTFLKGKYSTPHFQLESNHNLLSSAPSKNGGETSVEPPLLIGSFNIQTLGKKKFSKPDIMLTIEKVILRYDLILIMEVMTTEPHFMERLLRDVNRFAPKGVIYNMTLSESHPQTNEYCVFMYRTNKLKIIKTESFNDPDGQFYRKPYIVIFSSPTLRDMNQFGAIGLHVKPSQAVQELNALAELYDFAKDKYKTKDILLMGDFNADCSYVKEGDWNSIELWTRSEFTWAIRHNMDTTTNYKKCALDRFVYAGERMNVGVILSSAQVFNFQEEFDLTLQEARNVSDHWPIELKIRSKMSKKAEQYLTSKVCFTLHDSRLRVNLSADAVVRAASNIYFTATSLPGAVLLSNTTSQATDMLKAIQKIGLALPDVVTREQNQAIVYKLESGALTDESSFADVTKTEFTINVTVSKVHSEVVVCKTTSVN